MAGSPDLISCRQFHAYAVALGNMVRQHCLELRQQCLCRSQIATVVCQFGYDLSLAGNVIHAFGCVPLGLCKMPFEHGPVHAAS